MDDAFHAKIVAMKMNKMNKCMYAEEFAVYCLAYKKIWEGVPVRLWIHKFPTKHKWIIKRVLRENFGQMKPVSVNWLPIRSALARSVNPPDINYLNHLFALQPQRD